MKLLSRSLIALTSLLSITCVAQASALGINNPFGDPASSSTIGYALWETFSDANAGSPFEFPNTSPNASDTDLFTGTLSASMTGGVLTGGNDRIYDMGNAFNLSLIGTVTGDISSISLQVKMTPPAAIPSLTRLTFFTISLNGAVAQQLIETNSNTGEVAAGQAFGVIRYVWANLDLESGDTFTISITSPSGGHSSVDAFRVDAVPEPSTYAMLSIGAGAGFMVWVKRRRTSLASSSLKA